MPSPVAYLGVRERGLVSAWRVLFNPLSSCHCCFESRFELLEQLSQHQETAYERLYRWVQDRCQTLEEETPAADVTLQVSQSVAWFEVVSCWVCPASPGVLFWLSGRC